MRLHRVFSPARLFTSRATDDRIVEQLSYVDRMELHKLISINGRAAAPADEGLISRGEFGVLMDAMFQPATNASFKWQRTTNLNGRKVDVYAFRVPKARGYALAGRERTIVVGYTGNLYADAVTKAVIRIRMTCVDIPPNPDFTDVSLTLDYQTTGVAGKQFVLPAHYTLDIRNNLGVTVSEADYVDYRRFAAQTTVTFEQ
jgi:hypothetical protein